MININNKQWEKLRFSDIEKLLAGTDDETFFFEFKSDKESPAKLVKEVSAFANTYGGYILVPIRYRVPSDAKALCCQGPQLHRNTKRNWEIYY